MGSVTRAAQSAAESFGEGVAQGEVRGQRDVDRAAETVETGRERLSDTAAAVTAPVTERTSGRGTTTTATTMGAADIPTVSSAGRTAALPSETMPMTTGTASTAATALASPAAAGTGLGAGGFGNAGEADALDSFASPVKAPVTSSLSPTSEPTTTLPMSTTTTREAPTTGLCFCSLLSTVYPQ